MIFYKYRYINKHTFQMLINNELYFSTPENFNDPFDSQVLPQILINEMNQKQIYKNVMFNLGRNDLVLKNHDALFARQLNKNFNKEDIFPYTMEELKKTRVFSLSSLNNIALMWSHYANNHKGICLGFDFTETNFKLVKINYKNDDNYIYELSKNFEGEITQKIKSEIILHAMFTKDENWKYEEEYRITLSSKEHFLQKYPPASLKEVIFGLRCSDDDKVTIKNTLKDRSDIKYYEAIKKYGSFNLTIVPM